MNTSRGTVLLSLIFVAVFGIYLTLQKGNAPEANSTGETAQVGTPLEELVIPEEDLNPAEEYTPKEESNSKVPSLESFNPSDLQTESEDVNEGFDLLNKPF